METTLKTAEFRLVAANYDDMFAKIIKLVPTEKEWIKPEINWAKMILKRQDRITWWLRYYRLGLLKALVEGRGNLKKDPELQANYETINKMYEAEYRSLTNRTGITFPVPNIGQLDRLRNELDHFLSLPVAAIQNVVWDSQAPPDLVEEFKAHEDKWKAESEDEKRGLQIHEGDQIVVQFQDGWAWWKLGRGYCSEEAKAMGHCGNVNGRYNTDERILSLRKPVSGSKELWAPALTFILDGQGFIGEMKGRGNDKPSDKYHPYIVGLLEKTDLVKGIKGGGYLPSHNFALNDLDPETQDRLAETNPALQSARRQFRLLQEQKKIGWQFPEFREFVNRVEAAAQLEIQDGTWDDKLKGWIDNEWENPGEFIKDQLRHTQFGTTFEEMQGDSEMPSRGYELNDVMRGLIDRLDRASIDLIFDNLEAQPKVKEWLDKESAGTRYRNMYGVHSPRSRELLLGLLHASDPNIENYARWLQGKLWNVWRAGITDGVRQNMAAAMQEGLQNQTYARGPLGLYFEGKNKDTFWTAPVKTFYPLLTAIDKADGTGAFEPGEEEYQGDEYGDKWEVDWRYKDPVHEEYQKTLKQELKPIIDNLDEDEKTQIGEMENKFFRGQTAAFMDWVDSVIPGAWDQVADISWNLPAAKARLQQEFQQLDLPFGRAQHASLLLQKNATFAMIAANYEEMFNAITSFNPPDQRVKDIMAMTNGAARAKEEIQWAKQRLKKQDRIVWWMRWFRLNLLAELANNLGTAANDGKLYKDVGGQKPEQVQEAAAVQQAYDYFHKAFEADVRAMRARTGDEGINHQYNISRSLPHHNVVDHFLSLPVPEIQNTVWDRQTPKVLIKDTFEPAEKKWQDETKGLLKPHTEPDEDWEMEDPDKWRAAQSEVSQLTGHLKRLREGTAVRYIKRDELGTIIAESSRSQPGYTEEPIAGEDLQQAIVETEADLKDAQDRVVSLSQPEVDTVFIPFQDGWAWWRLSRAYCSEEAKAMGHCGNVVGQEKTDERILSLRQPVKRGKEDYWEPHLTFILEPNGKLGEMKGKANQKPAPQYHKYIIALLEDPRIKGVRGGGYAPERNFAMADLPKETQDAIAVKNPNLMALSRRLQLLQQGTSSGQGNMFPASARQWQKLRTDIEEILWPDDSDYSESLPTYDHTRNAWVTDTWNSVEAMVEQYGNDQAKWVSQQIEQGGGDFEYSEGVSVGDVISNNLNSKQEALLRRFIQVEYPDEVEAWMEEQREDGDEEPDFNDADLADFISEQSLDDVESKIMNCYETGARYGAESEMYKALMSAVEEFTIQETGEEIILPKYTDKDGKQGITWDSKVFSIITLAAGAALADKGEPWGYWKGSESEQPEITVEQPYYGWSGFDDDAFNEQIEEEFSRPETVAEKAKREAKQQKNLEAMAKKYPQAGVRRNEQGRIIGWKESPFNEENTKKWDAENKIKKKTKPKTKSRGASAGKMASEFNHVKNELLENLKALPYADEIKVFGGMATGHADRDPADIDLVIDLRGKTTHNSWTDLLALAKKYYGYLDPFIISDAGTMDGKPVFELWARNDNATGWIRSRNKKKMLKNMSEQGKPLSLIKPIELKKAAQNFTPQQMEREAEIWEDQFPANEPGGGPASNYVWHQDNQFPVAKLEGDAAFWKPWFDQEKEWAAEGGRPEQYYEKQEEWWTKNPDEHMVIVQGTDGLFYVWEGTHRLAISKIHDMQTVPAFVGIPKDNKTSTDQYLYHVTPEANLEDIKQHGLKREKGYALFEDTPKATHFTDASGVDFWVKEVTDYYGGPVAVLKVPKSKLRLSVDEQGTDDAKAHAYRVEDDVAPSDISLVKIAKGHKPKPGIHIDKALKGKAPDVAVVLHIEVPQEAREHFWNDPPEGNLEFWAFSDRPKAFLNEKIVFTFNKKPVAEARILKIEEPGSSKCEQSGRYEKHHKVFWSPSDFKKLASVKTADVPDDLNELQRPSPPEYDAVRYVVGYMQQNNIQQMPWKQFQQVFQQFAAKYTALFTKIRKNKPQVMLADLQEWLQEQQYNQPEQAEFGIEYDRYRNPETSFRDAEQLVLRINQGANAQRILGEDSALAQYVGFVGQSSEMSGHPAGRNTIGWLRVDFVNQEWLLVDEVQSDLVNSVSQARLIVEANNFDEFMASLANDHMRELVREKGIGPGNFAAAKRNFTGQGYSLEKLEEIKQKLIELSRNWAEYAISSVLEIARRQGIKNVAIHTAETIGQRDPGVESNKIKIFYDNLAKQFGFKKQQLDMGELSGNFWVRTANATKRVMAAGRGYKIDAHQSGDTIWIDWFEVPEGNRGKGLGRQYYEAWEASLPKSIKLLRLFAANAGQGPAAGFWDKMGFHYVYDTEQGDESDQYMWKGINGNPTPPPITEDRDEPEGYDIEDEPEKNKESALYHGNDTGEATPKPGRTMFFAEDPAYAERYGKVSEFDLTPDTKILDARTPEGAKALEEIRANAEGSRKIDTNPFDHDLPLYNFAPEVQFYAKPLGYDGAVFSELTTLGGNGIRSVGIWNVNKLTKTSAIKQLYYHGSDIKNLRAILTEGLMPEGKSKSWADDPNAGLTAPSRQTYGGIYLTRNLMTAIGAPRHGKSNPDFRMVMVTVEAQPNTLYLDEDSIVGILDSPFGNYNRDNSEMSVGESFMMTLPNAPESMKEILQNQQASYVENVVRYIKQRLEENKLTMAPDLEKRLRELLPGVFLASLIRRTSHAYKSDERRIKEDGYDARNYDYQRAYHRIMGDRVEVPSKDTIIPTPQDGEATFRKAAEQLTRTLRSMLRIQQNGGWSFQNARTTQPIGYSGSNHITCVMEIRDGRGHYIEFNDPEGYEGKGRMTPIVLHYGTVPEDFNQQWKERVGGKIYWLKPGETPPASTYVKPIEEPAVSEATTASIDKAAAVSSWFKGSKVVNEDGSPKPVFHGTVASSKIDKFEGESFAGWFAEDPKKAEIYSMGNGDEDPGTTYAVYLAIKNPLDLTSFDLDEPLDFKLLANVLNQKKKGFTNVAELQQLSEVWGKSSRMWGVIATRGFEDFVGGLGCDGIKAKEAGFITWAALSSEQVRSALSKKATKTAGKAFEQKLYRGQREVQMSRPYASDPGDFGRGIYWTSDIYRARAYGKNVQEQVVRLENPLYLTVEQAYDLEEKEYGDLLHGTHEQRLERAENMTKDLLSKGYDGLVATDKNGIVEVVDYRPYRTPKTSSQFPTFEQCMDESTDINHEFMMDGLEDPEEAYEETLSFWQAQQFPLTVYRALALKEGDKVRTQDAGLSWSLDRTEAITVAESLFSGRDIRVLEGTIGPEAVDWLTTFRCWMTPLGEREVRLKSGGRVKSKGRIITADRENEEGFWAGEDNAASGILPICSKTGRVALAVRSSEVDYPGTIATLGGGIKKGKSPSENAKIELKEETGYAGAITLTPAYVYTSEGGFKYHNFIGVVPEEFDLNPGSGSSAGLDHADELASMDWVPYEEVLADLKTNPSDYHPGFVKLLQNSKQIIERLLGIKKQASDKDTMKPLQLRGKMPMKGQSAKEAAGEKEMPAKIAAAAKTDGAIAEFQKYYGHTRGEGSFDRCQRTSIALQKFLKQKGIESQIYRVSEFKGNFFRAMKQWQEIGPFNAVHYVVVAEGKAIDFTFGQFDPKMPFPYVFPMEDLHKYWDDVNVWEGKIAAAQLA